MRTPSAAFERPVMTPSPDTEAAPQRPRRSALQRSALERLAMVSLPIIFLWIAVALALDLWR